MLHLETDNYLLACSQKTFRWTLNPNPNPSHKHTSITLRPISVKNELFKGGS